MSVNVDKDTGKWYYYGTYPKGHPKAGKWYKKRGFTTPKKAEKAEKEFRANWLDDNGEIISSITFKELTKELMDYSVDRVKHSTIISNKYIYDKINEQLGHVPLCQFNRIMLQEYIDKMDAEFSKNYVQRIYYGIQKAFSYAIKQGLMTTNYMKQVEMSARKNEIKQEIKYWELEDFEVFIKCVDELQWKTIFTVMYYMGLRRGEMMGLAPADINFKDNTMNIRYQYNVKTRKRTTPKSKNSTRIITMPSAVVEALKTYIERLKAFGTYDDNSTSLFLFGGQFPVSATNLDRKLSQFITKANENNNIPVITSHGFRHSHASYLINNMSDKFTVYDIAKRLGDTVNTVLSTYAHWFKAGDKKLVEMIDNTTNTEKPQKQAKNMDFSQLRELKQMLDDGILTNDEFTLMKKHVLGI